MECGASGRPVRRVGVGWGVGQSACGSGGSPAGLRSARVGVGAHVGGWGRWEGRLADAVVGDRMVVRHDLTSFEGRLGMRARGGVGMGSHETNQTCQSAPLVLPCACL